MDLLGIISVGHPFLVRPVRCAVDVQDAPPRSGTVRLQGHGEVCVQRAASARDRVKQNTIQCVYYNLVGRESGDLIVWLNIASSLGPSSCLSRQNIQSVPVKVRTVQV